MRARRRTLRANVAAPESSREKTIFLALRHPLTTLSTGFLFTVIIGGSISRHYESENSKQRIMDSRVLESAKLTDSAASYISYTRLLTLSIRNKEPEPQILQKKILYESSKVEWWKSTILLSSYIQRTTDDFTIYVFLSQMIRDEVDNSLVAMDECLQAALSERNIDNANNILDSCKPHLNGIGWQGSKVHSMEDRIEISATCISNLQGILKTYSTATENDLFHEQLEFIECRPSEPSFGAATKDEKDRNATFFEKIQSIISNILLEERPLRPLH